MIGIRPLQRIFAVLLSQLKQQFLFKISGGSIVITSSVNGNRIFKNFGASAYSTSKAGQVAFMKMAALELSGYNIRVNAICQGDFNKY